MRKPIQANRFQFERDGFTFVHDVLSSDEIEIFAPIFSERLPADKLPPGIPDAGLNGRKTLKRRMNNSYLALYERNVE